MPLGDAINVISIECGLDAHEFAALIEAIRTERNCRELVRLARLLRRESSFRGKVTMNCDRGSITDARVEARLCDLDRGNDVRVQRDSGESG